MNKAVLALILWILFTVPTFLGLGTPSAFADSSRESSSRRVAVVVSAPLRPYLEALKGLSASLAQLGFQPLQPITLPQDTQGDFRTVQNELLRLSADVFISIGPEALPLVEKVCRTRNLPWVYTMVLDPTKLVSHAASTPCGVSLSLPAAEQIQAIVRTFPQRKHLGVFYSTPANRDFLQEAQRHAENLGLTLHPIPVTGPKDVPDRLSRSLPHLDALWIIPDPAIDSRALVEYLVETALLHNVPSIGYNRYFLEAGAAMAFVLDYEKIGAATAMLLDLSLRSNRCPEVVPAYDVLVNEHVMRRLIDHSKDEKR